MLFEMCMKEKMEWKWEKSCFFLRFVTLKGGGGVYPKKIDFLCLYILERSSVKGSGTFTELKNFTVVSSSRVSKLGGFWQFRAKSAKKGQIGPFKKDTF